MILEVMLEMQMPRMSALRPLAARASAPLLQAAVLMACHVDLPCGGAAGCVKYDQADRRPLTRVTV